MNEIPSGTPSSCQEDKAKPEPAEKDYSRDDILNEGWEKWGQSIPSNAGIVGPEPSPPAANPKPEQPEPGRAPSKQSEPKSKIANPAYVKAPPTEAELRGTAEEWNERKKRENRERAQQGAASKASQNFPQGDDQNEALVSQTGNPEGSWPKNEELPRTEEYSQNPADEDPANEWAKKLKTTVLAGEAISKVMLPPRQLIIPEWFTEGDCGFIFAPRGLGKTWMNLGLGLAISTKGCFGPYQSEVSWPVLYVDGEMPFDVMRQRITALRGSSPPENFHLLSHEILFQQEEAALNLTNCAPQQALIDFCLAKGIRVLILDNLSCLFSGLKENEADAWEPAKRWLLTLRRHRIAVIVVHHSGRNPNYMRGTTRREDDVFWVMRLEEPADAKITHGTGARFITRFTKSRGAPAEPGSYDWKIEPEGNGNVGVTFVETSADDILVAWVRDDVTTANAIAHEMGVSPGMISRRAKRLIEAGRLIKNGREYALGEVEEENWNKHRDWSSSSKT